MSKYSSLFFLVAVAIFWSSVDAKATNARRALDLNKREITVDNSEGFNEREAIAVLLLGTVGDPVQKAILRNEFQDALRKDWLNTHEYTKHVTKFYRDVTGSKLFESIASN